LDRSTDSNDKVICVGENAACYLVQEHHGNLKPPTEAKAQRVVVSRAFHATALLAPVVIPKEVNDIDKMAAPDVGTPSGVVPGSSSTNSSIDGDLFGTGAEPPPPASPAKNAVSGPMRIGGIIAEANLIRKVQPTYPPLAKAARVQGTVEFTATISKEGKLNACSLCADIRCRWKRPARRFSNGNTGQLF